MMSKNKLDQIAYYAHNEEQVQQIKKFLGLENAQWAEDFVKGIVSISQNGSVKEFATSTGHLRFNYDLGIELEILTYLSGPHWHKDKKPFIDGLPFLSHVGIHMDQSFKSISQAGDAIFNGTVCRIGKASDSTLCQRMITTSHTNGYVNSHNRNYLYEIHNTQNIMGVDTKYIYRIQP